MDISPYLFQQINLHPSLQPQDIVKMCYQAAYGAEHLLADTNKAKQYLVKEYSEVQAAETLLSEQISDNVTRINLASWKANNLPLDWLFNMFVASCKVENNGQEKFNEYLSMAEKIINTTKVNFNKEDWNNFLKDYDNKAVHHSEQYRSKEKPAYRIVNSAYAELIPILLEINKHKNENDKAFVISIDGRAASGKTTLANNLKTILDGEVIHMDDFFLPLELRSEERLNEAGGNVHYERFKEEVLPFISTNQPFNYRVFDCSIMDYNSTTIISNKEFRIVEGAYSCHPSFGNYADFIVFSDIDYQSQIERIRNRNGETMLNNFINTWIPMEEKYFTTYNIKELANYIYNN